MMMILSVMQKMLEQSGIRGVVINNQILHAFRKKIQYLQEAFKNASHKGGNVCKSYQLIGNWGQSEGFLSNISRPA